MQCCTAYDKPYCEWRLHPLLEVTAQFWIHESIRERGDMCLECGILLTCMVFSLRSDKNSQSERCTRSASSGYTRKFNSLLAVRNLKGFPRDLALLRNGAWQRTSTDEILRMIRSCLWIKKKVYLQMRSDRSFIRRLRAAGCSTRWRFVFVLQSLHSKCFIYMKLIHLTDDFI